MIVANAASLEVLRKVHVAEARAVVVATSDELINLEVGLLVRELNPLQRVVVRMTDHRLARALRDMAESGAWDDLWLIFGALADKEVEPMARELFPLADRLILTRGRSDRFREPRELARLAESIGCAATVTQSCEEAIRAAREQAAPGDAICLCGSLYLVGDALEALGIEPFG